MQSTMQTSDYQHILHVDVYPLEVNWPQLIDDITRHGIRPAQQANMLGKGWSTFQRWLNGTQPGFKNGHAILILHQKICGPDLTLERFRQMDLGE